MLKEWVMATRPWSFTATTIPIALGAELAWRNGSFSWTLFLLTLVGALCIQAGTNLINTYGDYISGVDSLESAVTCPQLVAGLFAPQSVKKAGLIAFFLAFIVGLVLTWFCGWMVLAFGVVGIVAGYCYTAGFCPYKYQGLGSVAVFFLMGPLLVWPAYYIQTGEYSLLPLLSSVPVGLLVAGILHGNDIRDFAHDRHAGIKTLALALGFQKSIFLYELLAISAYVCLIVLVWTDRLPWAALLPFIHIPVLLKTFWQIRKEVKTGAEIDFLEAKAAGFHFQFGVLLISGIFLFPYLNNWLYGW